MFALIRLFFLTFLDHFRRRDDLTLEVLALRHQIAVLQRNDPRSRFSRLDRIFWAWLVDRWPDWRRALVLVKA